MKILSAAQLKEADALSIQKQEITSEALMERAATLVFEKIHSRLKGSDTSIKIFCGIGNNGGDGLVVARLLLEKAYKVQVFIVSYSDNRTEDFLTNFKKLKNEKDFHPLVIKSEEDFPEISHGDFVIDAIFGIGLNRQLDRWVAGLVEYINKSQAFILAVDMPSGLFSENIPGKNDAVISANITLTFQTPKLVFFLPETMNHAGEVQVLDIGLDQEYISKVSAKAKLVNRQEALKIYKPRKKNTHKGDYGHSLIVGGSYGKMGSIVLTATATLRTGAGLCSIFSPKCGYSILQTALPEAMVIADKNKKTLTKIETDLKPDVICFGMGVGKSIKTKLAFEDLLQNSEKPMLIDADGLNLLSENKNLLKFIPRNSVLTPHPKELQRLIGKWKDDFEKIEKVQAFIKKYHIILVLKGAHTFIFTEDLIYINNTGNPGMATAGSGDVLSGIITALISQKYTPAEAAVLGVYLHGKAGDIAVGSLGYESLLAGDIAKNMGKAFLDFA